MDFADEITLTGLRTFGHHGVFEHERHDGQFFVVDLTLAVNTRRAAETDEVTDTVHYGEVAEAVAAIVSGEPVNLLETLAARIADRVLDFDGVSLVRVTVHKPSAPITVSFTDVAVTITRGRAFQ
ncbi:hypothetical protein ASD65_11425 [Microbacterium sp. Root61]|uniref:dihydroneopterin aldolase n=1 Tax=Microbacterium sp. Root61 TaxID=1736570 RepID=UPI0006FF36CD|nr:dihydroneopterin aldolase [Microbacterium sp. Root61]KRA24969.1 hypothetical protein ASD65_11425 [Microbacterium sp. Root61]